VLNVGLNPCLHPTQYMLN